MYYKLKCSGVACIMINLEWCVIFVITLPELFDALNLTGRASTQRHFHSIFMLVSSSSPVVVPTDTYFRGDCQQQKNVFNCNLWSTSAEKILLLFPKRKLMDCHNRSEGKNVGDWARVIRNDLFESIIMDKTGIIDDNIFDSRTVIIEKLLPPLLSPSHLLFLVSGWITSDTQEVGLKVPKYPLLHEEPKICMWAQRKYHYTKRMPRKRR